MIRIWILITLLTLSYIRACPRAPSAPHGRRTRGDNFYKLILGDNPSGYEPGKTYNLLLLGSRTHNKLQQFTHFTLTAEASNGNGKRGTPAGPRRVGRFQLYADSLTKFSEKCINTITEADDLPKTEIQVMWVAPAAGSGCVSLSAMVYEGPRSWFADDGELTKILCEKKSDADSIKKECCACNEAKYSFVFEGIWSNETHPKDFPFAVWLTHFSDIVGGSHDSNFSFWGENHIATDGFRSLAEWGSPTSLENELRAKGSRLRTLIKAPGLWYPHVNTNTTSTFRVDRKHHKVSMVSMFGPSPDWVVGINGLNLCTEDCSWKSSVDIDLYPWDAGTDSGISYMSSNAETQPRERMSRITTMYPEDPRAPFYNPTTDKMTPLAKLFIRRENIINRNCDDDFLQALLLEESQSEDQDTRAECTVTPYRSWTPCSVTCGKGIRSRSREYVNEALAIKSNCKTQLVSKEMCVAAIPECSSNQEDEVEGENLDKLDPLGGICRTTAWSNFNECSASCGIGITMRTRSFINHLGRKRCPHIAVVEKQKCMKPDCTFEAEELPDSECPTTQWSDWSPCTATCGKGVTIRTRLLLVEPHQIERCEKRIELNEQKECTITQDCTVNLDLAKEFCQENADQGPCRSSYRRYWYNYQSQKCEGFIYGGCRGNKNNFFTEEECMNTCHNAMKGSNDQYTSRQPLNTQNSPNRISTTSKSDRLPQDCIMSDWSEWSICSATCGEGISERHRYVVRYPSNGGQQCQKKTVKRRRCIVADCN